MKKRGEVNVFRCFGAVAVTSISAIASSSWSRPTRLLRRFRPPDCLYRRFLVYKFHGVLQEFNLFGPR